MSSVGNFLTGRRSVRPFARFRGDDTGATAVEFALVATPFLMFVFGLIGFALYFFTMTSIENATDYASRLIRTGQAVTDKMTIADFKAKICNTVDSKIDCQKLQVFPLHWSDWSKVAPAPCVDNNNAVIMSTAQPTELLAIYTGAASDVVIVTTCYEWEFPSKIPFLKLGNMQNGSMMLQTSTAFRSEPYPTQAP